MTRQLDMFSIPVLVEKPQLRPYQLKGVEDLRALIAKGYLRILLTMPTGGGKTVVASHIIDMARLMGMTILFVAHRIELINQTARQLARFGVTDIGVIRGNDKRDDDSAPVQIASIDTLRNRKPSKAPNIIFIDEAHRSMADSYKELFALYPNALFIGLTASPFRTDNQGLGEVYEALVVCARPSQLIEDGFIEAPRIFNAPVLPDLTSVEFSTDTHDYHNKQLASAMMKSKLMGCVVDEWMKHAQGRRTVAFAVNVEHSKLIVEEFKKAGVRAAHLDAKTPESERSQMLLQLEKYELQVISNCDVLSEGWDQPSVKCVLLVRPTCSLRVHIQQCGRILRPWDVKHDVFCDAPGGPLIIDHAGNIERHGHPCQDRQFDLTTGQRSGETSPVLHTCQQCYSMWIGSSRACPNCGVVKPVEERKMPSIDESIILREVDTSRILTKEGEMRNFFIKELLKCREMGKKPGAASFRYKEKYGKFPPYNWKTQADSMYSQDQGWQSDVAKRSQAREHWQREMQDRRTAIEEPSAGDFVRDDGYTEIPDDDIPF